MNLIGTKVLVTGADGFIGSHLVEGLIEKGCKVKAMSFYNSFGDLGWLEALSDKHKKEIQVVSGDIRDEGFVRHSVKDVEVVFHLAALIAIPYSYIAPSSYVSTNIQGTLNVLQACRDFNIEKLLHTSTSEVYGTAQYVPIDEEHPLVGQSPYSASKIGADQMALSFEKSFGTPVAIIRPFNTFGPRQSARAIIPTIISQIVSGKTEIEIGSMSPTRDFTYVSDTAAGFIAAAESEFVIGQVTNLGSGFEISIGETLSLIEKITGKKINIKQDPQRLRPEKSEVNRLFADISTAKNRIPNWSPKFSGKEGFEKGLVKTIEWFSSEENLKRYKADKYNV